jgi:hypothetical protein
MNGFEQFYFEKILSQEKFYKHKISVIYALSGVKARLNVEISVF